VYHVSDFAVLSHNTAIDCSQKAKMVGHHTIPKQIQQMISLSDPRIRGVRGNPNVKKIPEELHKAIHTGGNGGAYNARFIQEIEKIKTKFNRDVTPDDILAIREMLVKEFGL
jgi:hypothetical protein